MTDKIQTPQQNLEEEVDDTRRCVWIISQEKGETSFPKGRENQFFRDYCLNCDGYGNTKEKDGTTIRCSRYYIPKRTNST